MLSPSTNYRPTWANNNSGRPGNILSHFTFNNQLQINNVTEGGKEGKVMHFYDDFQNDPYQTPTLTSDQQQQI